MPNRPKLVNPATREVPVPAEAGERIVTLDQQAAFAAALRDTFHQGLCAGLGVRVEDVLSYEADRGVLIVREEPAAE